MKKSTRRIYDEDYAPQPSEEDEGAELQQQDEDEDEDCLGTYLDGNASDKVGDEFKYFTTAEPPLSHKIRSTSGGVIKTNSLIFARWRTISSLSLL
jgi:hypothetical protein